LALSALDFFSRLLLWSLRAIAGSFALESVHASAARHLADCKRPVVSLDPG
jgi:hypothetical protein